MSIRNASIKAINFPDPRPLDTVPQSKMIGEGKMIDDMLHVMKWHNGDKEYSPFSEAEMTRRQDDVRRWMAANKVDAALFTSYHCINYYSGWLYCYFGRKYGMVIDHAKATTISAGIDGGQPWRRSFGDNITYTDWRRDNFYSAVRQLAAGAKRVGIEFDHVSLDFRRQLEEALPGVEFVDIGQPSMWMRTIKSAEEHKLIREGARVCDVGGAACVAAVKAGVPEHEVAIATTNAMIREIAKSHPFVELMDTWTWFQSGINTDGAHNPVTNRVVQSGDILSLNTFPMIFGYYTALGAHPVLRPRRRRQSRHLGEERRRAPSWARADQAGCTLQGHRHRAQRDVPAVGSAEVPVVRLRPLVRCALPLLRPRGRRGTARGHRDRVLKPGMVVSMEPMVMLPEGACPAPAATASTIS
jgi:creatinase